WISAQQSMIGLRWLLNEVSLRTGGRIQVDPASMSGSVLGEPGEIYLHPEEMAIHATHAQINWLGYRSAQAETLVILNDGDRTTVEVRFPIAAKGSAKILHTNDGKEWSS